MEKKSCNVRVYFQETLREKQPSLSRGHSTQTHSAEGTRHSKYNLDILAEFPNSFAEKS